jgi:hypothetical protein
MSRVDTAEKVRENRLRRVAGRRGLRLEKSRRRDPQAMDYGLFWIVQATGKAVVPSRGMTLTEVEAWLDGGRS